VELFFTFLKGNSYVCTQICVCVRVCCMELTGLVDYLFFRHVRCWDWGIE